MCFELNYLNEIQLKGYNSIEIAITELHLLSAYLIHFFLKKKGTFELNANNPSKFSKGLGPKSKMRDGPF